MSKQEQLLKAHGIETRFRNGVLFVKEEWVKNGKSGFSWIVCPKDIKRWLGY